MYQRPDNVVLTSSSSWVIMHLVNARIIRYNVLEIFAQSYIIVVVIHWRRRQNRSYLVVQGDPYKIKNEESNFM